MKHTVIYLLIICGLSTELSAQFLDTYQWRSRLILLFTPAADDPLFERQVGLLRDEVDELRERDVTVLWITPDGDRENTGLFLQQSLAQQYYDHFSPRRDIFELILVGLDGTEKYRASNKDTPPSVLFNLIDEMPMRRQELRQEYRNKRKTTKEGGS
ncbi:MAG: DUF4174 domain-containing protein [Bacteroidota bacterium]